LEAEGVDTEAAQGSRRLMVVDTDELLPEFMRDAMPDAPVFLGLASDVIGRRATVAVILRSAGGAKWSMCCGGAGTSPRVD
jgi:hypothetical protein